jgi:hypothetical protein
MKTADLNEETGIPAGLESRLEILINQLAETEKQLNRKKRRLHLWAGSVAATILLLFSTGLFLKSGFKPFNGKQTVQAIADPETAYMEMQKALELVSLNFNKGLNQLNVVTCEIEKSNQIFNKALKQ